MLCVGELQSFTRSCSPLSLPPSCVTGVDSLTSRRVRLCYWTCDEDGCNSARSIHYLLELIRRRKRPDSKHSAAHQ